MQSEKMTRTELRAAMSLAAAAGDIWTAIVGRALQGAGAVNSVAMALGGWIAAHFGSAGVFSLCAALCGIWLAVAGGMCAPARVGAVNGGPGIALSERQRT
jgi:hypothetical protein